MTVEEMLKYGDDTTPPERIPPIVLPFGLDRKVWVEKKNLTPAGEWGRILPRKKVFFVSLILRDRAKAIDPPGRCSGRFFLKFDTGEGNGVESPPKRAVAGSRISSPRITGIIAPEFMSHNHFAADCAPRR